VYRLLNFFKNTLHVVAITAGILVLVLFVTLHYNLAGLIIETDIQQKISQKLNTRVEIGDIEVTWTNQIAMNQLVIFDQKGDTLFYARRAMVALEIVPLLQQKLIVNTVQVIDFQLLVRKESLDSNANYDFLVEALMPKQKDQRRKFINDISLNALLLRQGKITYDVLDQPYNTHPTLPDHNHLDFDDISARLSLEVSHKTGLDITLKRMSWKEKSGVSLHNLMGKGHLASENLLLDKITIEMYHILSDGERCDLIAHGQAQLFEDSLSLQVQSFDMEAHNWGEIHSRIAIDSRLDSCPNVEYDVEFLPSQISTYAISLLSDAFDVDIPKDVLQWFPKIDKLQWKGALVGNNIDETSFVGNVQTSGKVSSKIASEISYQRNSHTPYAIKLRGDIFSIPFHNHTYRNIKIDGQYLGDKLNADFICRDPMCLLEGHADINFAEKETTIQGYADIQSFSPYDLRLSSLSNIEDLTFRGIAQVDLVVPNNLSFDSLTFDLNNYPMGYVRVDSLRIKDKDNQVELGTTRISIQREQESAVFAVVSPMINLIGTQTSLIGYIPSFPAFTQMLKLPGKLVQDMTIQAEWDSVQHQFTINASIPEWVKDDASYSFLVQGNGETQTDKPIPTHLKTNVQFSFKNSSHELQTDLALDYEPDPMKIQLEPSVLTIDNKPFKTSNAILKQEDNSNFRLENLLIEDQDQKLEISGMFGNEKDLKLDVQLDNWQLDFFLDMLNKEYLDFGGYASGNLDVYKDSTLQLKTYSLAINDFTYIGNNLGDAELTCFGDLDKGKLKFIAQVESSPNHLSYAECDVRIHEIHDTVDLRVQLDSLPIEFLSYWIGGAVQDLHGHGSGEVRLYGDCDSLNLEGKPLLQNVNFTNDLLGARFYITDTIIMEAEPNSKGFIGLNNVTVRDRNGQKAILTLDVEHQHLHNMEYGLDLDIPETNQGFLLYDHPTQNNGDLYWGRLWATGRCQMHGTYSNHRINVQMSPAGKSIFSLSPGEENFTENGYNFLTFRDKEKAEKEEAKILQALREHTYIEKETEEEPTYIEADLLIQANEHCQVYVQLDPLAEDRLICRGNGDLALHYDPHHDLALTGNYDITSGSYTVTMKGDVMTKAFQLQQGSRVTFPGVPSDAELGLKAVYNIPSANLKDLDESFASLASLNRTTLPVDCKLNVTGPITAPQIAFDLEVKNTSDDVQALVHNIIGTQEMLNREVFYLLLFSKFYTPEYASTSQRQTGSELTSFASSSLTSQLNNLLGHMSDNFTLGTNFRSDKGDFTDMEMDVSVSTRLLNDRLLMTGNLGYRDPANSIGLNTTNNTFIGDFDVEFLINTKGTVRAKAYSHYNERDYSINNALTTQGIGIILRKDFKSIYDLINRKQ